MGETDASLRFHLHSACNIRAIVNLIRSFERDVPKILAPYEKRSDARSN